MFPRSNEWLLTLVWVLDKTAKPTWRRLFESCEAWEYRNVLRHRLRYLERQWLLTQERRAKGLVCRLTELGRVTALGGRDSEARWGRHWDGKWRMVLFDLPGRQQKLRQRLLRWLRENSFGYLQNSVWISPDPLAEVAAALEDFRDDVEAFTIMDAQCCAGYSNEAIVQGAWDFREINRRYQAYLGGDDRALPQGKTSPSELAGYLRSESSAWRHAVWLDPLLPRVLLPREYLGVRAWQAKRRVLSALAERVAQASPVA